MAKDARLTEQAPFVGTPDQKILLLTLADLVRGSQADVVRWALNAAFGFTSDNTVPGGTTLEQMVTDAYTAMTGRKDMKPEVIRAAVADAREAVDTARKARTPA